MSQDAQRCRHKREYADQGDQQYDAKEVRIELFGLHDYHISFAIYIIC